ncbi:MAG: hypothetical protein AB8I08_11260 [Sandaracinaceae bacterium]
MPDASEAEPTVRDARDRFFRENEFGLDGGYDASWAEAEFGPVRYRVPNLRARAAALRVHDLHHLVTGYATDWRGESEISAWELGSGWGRYPYAWIIALFGLFTGLVTQPGATWRAFLRGRKSDNLFRARALGDVLEQPLASVRRGLGVPARGTALLVQSRDVVAFIATSLLSLSFAIPAVPVALGLVGLSQADKAYTWATAPTPCPLAGLCHS